MSAKLFIKEYNKINSFFSMLAYPGTIDSREKLMS